MMRRWMILAVLLTLAACQPVATPDDDAYRKAIVGKWSGRAVSSYSEKTYRPDGTASGFVSRFRRDATGKPVEVFRVGFKSRWRIEDGILDSYDVTFSDGTRVDVIRDRIISMSDRRAEYEALTDGRRFTRERIP